MYIYINTITCSASACSAVAAEFPDTPAPSAMPLPAASPPLEEAALVSHSRLASAACVGDKRSDEKKTHLIFLSTERKSRA